MNYSNSYSKEKEKPKMLKVMKILNKTVSVKTIVKEIRPVFNVLMEIADFPQSLIALSILMFKKSPNFRKLCLNLLIKIIAHRII